MESDGEDYRTKVEQQRHKGIKGDAKEMQKAMQRAMIEVQKGVPLCRDGKEWQDRQARAKGRQPEP